MSILLLDTDKKATLPRDHSTASPTEIQDRCYYILAGLAVSQYIVGKVEVYGIDTLVDEEISKNLDVIISPRTKARRSVRKQENLLV
jgi:hypothetical protein